MHTPDCVDMAPVSVHQGHWLQFAPKAGSTDQLTDTPSEACWAHWAPRLLLAHEGGSPGSCEPRFNVILNSLCTDNRI